MKLSFKLYAYSSLAAVCLLLLFSYIAHDSLYYAFHFLCTDRVSVAIVTNFLFAALLGFFRIFVSIFLGRLRDLEVEQIFDVGRGFLLDTVMFLVLSTPTIDDEEVPTLGILQFVAFIVALKLFHLICQTRVAHFFESGNTSGSALVRLLGLMLILICVDLVAVRQFYSRSHKKASLYLWLFFECVGMTASAFANLAKFSFHYIDSQMEGGWPGTSASIFFLDVLSDILSLAIFLVFMVVFIISYPSRLPVHMTSDIILVGRALFGKLRSFQRYRQLVKEMAKRFPEATVEELNAADTCIICRDLLHIGSRKLPCGHIFHVECLKAWFVQQQSCPTCRANVFQTPAGTTETETERQSVAPTPDGTRATEGAEQTGVTEGTSRSSTPDADRLNGPSLPVFGEGRNNLNEVIDAHPLQFTNISSAATTRANNSPCLSRNNASTAESRARTAAIPRSCELQLTASSSSDPLILILTRQAPSTRNVGASGSSARDNPGHPVSTFLRRLVNSVVPSLTPQDSGREQHGFEDSNVRFPFSGPLFVTTRPQFLSSSRFQVRRRRVAPDNTPTQQLSAQVAVLRQSMEKASQLSDFFRRQSLYWLNSAKRSQGHATSSTNCSFPTSDLFPFNNFQSPFQPVAEPCTTAQNESPSFVPSSLLTSDEFENLLPPISAFESQQPLHAPRTDLRAVKKPFFSGPG